ncbi:Outer membrane protein assembly factor BamB, contains PQQ-like beta-propeller repeat [Halopenitus malekzadehii]|uniref:Outer membrane protein assembly factor BamB, contains PQQ-like beta-propeller repeat n=1 Tax=Halopenitus malekzadehii TaxID=1267564 RepID=A0A1H6JFY3_9EURY|nr:PQQ-binding-like beta-propeller repeat protein [Halopenitus malekzadehii]SEH58004.1 Outer membrane protein assembly factor BamB, contains PQQ-like beta-propeller repeat [Halopenitus malekzadehii]
MSNPPDDSARDGALTPSRRRYLAGVASAAAATGAAGCLDGWGHATLDRSQADFDPDPLPGDRTYPDDDGVTMFRRGLRRLGYYPDATVPDSVTVNWQFPANYIGHTAAKASPRPAPDGETIVIPADTGLVHAVGPKGRHQWTQRTGATSLGIHGTPAIVDGIAYIGGYDGDLYAFDVGTGEQVWRTSRMAFDGAIAIGSSPAYWDGVLYVVVEYNNPPAGTLWAVDADTGRPLWSDDRLWGMPHPSVSIDPEHERLITASNDGVCYCWEFPSLAFEWSFQTGAEIKGTIPQYEGRAFVGSWDGNFHCLDTATGEGLWSFETGQIIMSNPGIDPDTGIVYMGSDDEHVHALDMETGDVVWSRDVGGHVIGSVTVTADAVLVGSYDRNLYALEKDTGEIRWTVPNNGHVTSAAVPHDGRIYYAERADITGYWNDDESTTVRAPGHAYCLVDDS